MIHSCLESARATRQARVTARQSALAACAALAISCTNDFDKFQVGNGAFAESGGSSGASGGLGGGPEGGAGVSGSASGGASPAGSPDASAGSGGSGGFTIEAGTPDTGPDGALLCGPGQKLCDRLCASTSDPAAGCGAESCDPCTLNNATAICAAGACAIDQCTTGFEDCNEMTSDGCERSLEDDPLHCGECDRACAGTGVAGRVCSTGSCASSCEVGFANCMQPGSGPDDGCETDVSSDTQNCGGCGNQCRGFLTCESALCGCSVDADCREEGGPSGFACDAAQRLCVCGTTTCKQGEGCKNAGCVCNGGPPCGTEESCCQTGCRNLQRDASNCGACGRGCTPGFACQAGACACDDDADCDAGSSGTCTSGLCTCSGTSCTEGERCLAGGGCG